jgi:hypothetical protein
MAKRNLISGDIGLGSANRHEQAESVFRSLVRVNRYGA